jgi:hypothetical protein
MDPTQAGYGVGREGGTLSQRRRRKSLRAVGRGRREAGFWWRGGRSDSGAGADTAAPKQVKGFIAL